MSEINGKKMNWDDYLIYDGCMNLKNVALFLEKYYPEYCKYLISEIEKGDKE